MTDAPLPHSTQALLTTVARMADEGTTSPEGWCAIGDVILQHGGWLERYLRTVGKRPDSMALTFEFLGRSSASSGASRLTCRRWRGLG